MINEPNSAQRDIATENRGVLNERDLVERAQRSDPEAFAVIYDEYFDKVYRYTFQRVGNRTEAEDLTQHVFLNVVQSISSYRWRGIPFSSWLFRIARNQVIDYWRKTSKYRTITLDLEMEALNSDPESIAEQSMDIKWLRGVVTNLTQLQQEVLSLRFAGELSTAETAKVMGKSEGAVKALQHSALTALKKMLPEEESHKAEV